MTGFHDCEINAAWKDKPHVPLVSLIGDNFPGFAGGIERIRHAKIHLLNRHGNEYPSHLIDQLIMNANATKPEQSLPTQFNVALHIVLTDK